MRCAAPTKLAAGKTLEKNKKNNTRRRPRVLDATGAEIRKQTLQTLHRLRHRDRDRRGGVRAGHLQARRLDRELVLDDRLAPLGRYPGLLEDGGLQSRRL